MLADPLRVLLVDDSVADAQLMECQLQQAFPEGVCVEHRLTAAEGAGCAAEGDVDCVLVDYVLDDESGLELVRSIRSSGNDVPILAVSGSGSERVAVDALKLQAQDYLVKDQLTPDSLGWAVTRAIEQVGLERELHEQRQAIESFASVAAHDLRGPVASAQSLLSLVTDGSEGDCSPEAMEVLRRVARLQRRTMLLIQKLLEYTKAGRKAGEPEPVSLDAVVSACRENLSVEIEQSLAVIDHGHLPDVLGEDMALIQLVQNLLSNAIKFCRDRVPRIAISAERRHEEWLVSIADNGIGVPQDMVREVFAPFRRLHNRRDFDGAGIGLATCRRIIARHGGEIWLESEPGSGTTVRFTLPRSPTTAQTAPRQNAGQHEVAAAR